MLDYIRNFDLNYYTLGLAVSAEQNPYVGAKNSAFAYPNLMSFRDPAFTNDLFLIRDGNVDVRWVSKSGWELGAVINVRKKRRDRKAGKFYGCTAPFGGEAYG